MWGQSSPKKYPYISWMTPVQRPHFIVMYLSPATKSSGCSSCSNLALKVWATKQHLRETGSWDSWWNMVKQGKQWDIKMAPTALQPPCWVAIFSEISRSLHSHHCISLRPHSTRDPNYPWWFASDGFLWPGPASVWHHMGVSWNAGTQQPWVFPLKMIILGWSGGTTIWGNTHILWIHQGEGLHILYFLLGILKIPRLSLHFFHCLLPWVFKSIPKALRVWSFWYLWPVCVKCCPTKQAFNLLVCQIVCSTNGLVLVKVGWGWNSRDRS